MEGGVVEVGFVARGGCYGNGSDLGVFLGLRGMERVSPRVSRLPRLLGYSASQLAKLQFLATKALAARFLRVYLSVSRSVSCFSRCLLVVHLDVCM